MEAKRKQKKCFKEGVADDQSKYFFASA